jgi:hypothetical protein
MLCAVTALGLVATSGVYAGQEQYEYDYASQPLYAGSVLRDVGNEATPLPNAIRTETQSNAPAKFRLGGSSAYQDYAGQRLPRGDVTRQIAGEGTPGAGANGLYTRLQAHARIVNAGFTDVTGLKKNFRADWRGQAMKDGFLNQVTLSARGDVTNAVSKTFSDDVGPLAVLARK